MISFPSTEDSLWRESYHDVSYPRLKQEMQVDVAIVGAGITGLTAAYLLKKAGKTVVVLDKDTVGGGTTGRTTGKVTAQHNLIYDTLISKHGKAAAQHYADANMAALELVSDIIAKEHITCDFERDDNYVYTTKEEEIETFRKEAAAAQSLGLPATFETSSPLPFDIKAGVKFSHQAKINAQAYVIGLAKAVNGDGCYVFEHSNVIGIRDGHDPRVRTQDGKVFAQHIIVATNVPTLPLMARGGYCVLEYPNESYIVAGEQTREQKGMYISPDKHQYSILPVTMEGRPMLLIGGEGHLSGVRISKKARFERLAQYAEKHFGITKITHMWSDRDYLAYDDIPLVGKLYPWSQHVYVATAMKKWGMTNGTASAMMLADAILGVESPWAETFDSTRLKQPVMSIPGAVVREAHKLFP